jgi:hypothetical protein
MCQRLGKKNKLKIDRNKGMRDNNGKLFRRWDNRVVITRVYGFRILNTFSDLQTKFEGNLKQWHETMKLTEAKQKRLLRLDSCMIWRRPSGPHGADSLDRKKQEHLARNNVYVNR